jgi:hypothetical protein
MSGGATLNLVDLGLAAIPAERLAGAEAVGTLNLSENELASPAGLAAFSRVHTLVLDKNGLRGCAGFPVMPAVTTLWFNNNEVVDVVGFLDDVARAFPAVTYLSCVHARENASGACLNPQPAYQTLTKPFPALAACPPRSCMRNPCSPPLVCVSEDDVQATRRHRLYVAFRLPRLQFLDSSPVTAAERKEAAEKGAYLAPRRPKAAAGGGEVGGGGAGSPAAGPPLVGGGLSTAGAAAAAAEKKKPASFLGVGASTYDGRNSEGNRFITDRSL